MANYDSYADSSAAPSKAGVDDTAPEKEDDAEEAATALLPKNILGGKDFKPGEEVVLKIEHIYEDEVEVSYASGKSSDKGEPEPSMDDVSLKE